MTEAERLEHNRRLRDFQILDAWDNGYRDLASKLWNAEAEAAPEIAKD